MMINPLVQFLGIEPIGSAPGLPTADGAPKGLFAALFGEQQAALLAETTGAPVLLWPDGTLSAAVEGEAIPLGALLVLPDGTQLTAFGQPVVEDSEVTVPQPEGGETDAEASSTEAPQAVPIAMATPGDSKPEASPAKDADSRLRNVETVPPTPVRAASAEGKAESAQTQANTNRVVTEATPWRIEAESYTGSRLGGAGAFAASAFAAQGAQVEAGLARDALRVLAAPAADGDTAPQSPVRADIVRPAGESVPLTGQGPSPASNPGLEARNEAAAMRAGIAAERPSLGTLGEFTVRAVRVLAADGEHTMTVRLVPESLGELKLTVRTAGDSVHVHVVAASAAVRDAFDSQMQGLRDALSKEGIDLARVTVGSETAGQHASARQSGNDAGQSQANAGGHSSMGIASPGDELLSAYRYAPRAPDAVLDLFA